MTRKETIELLQFLKGCYPNAKIDDAKGMVNAWQLAFSEFKADEVYKAARLHMVTCKYFPTPADIKSCISRACLIYNEDLPANNEPVALPTGNKDLEEDADDFVIKLWEFLWND